MPSTIVIPSSVTQIDEWARASENYNARIHRHNYDIAAPSASGAENDFQTCSLRLQIFQKLLTLLPETAIVNLLESPDKVLCEDWKWLLAFDS